MSQIQRERTIQHARSLIGTKWRHRGRTQWAIDCVGLVVMSVQAGGVDLKDDTNYGRQPWNDNLQARLQKNFGDPIHESQWQVGDVALFKAIDKAPCHIGLLGDYKYGGFSLVHSHAQHNTIEHALDKTWLRLLVEVYSPWEV